MVKRLLLLLVLVSTPAWASHIVGGEFELLHVEGSTYKLNLNLYFDVVNGNPGARDNQANVRIYRKSDNQPMMDVTLPFISTTRVDYFQPDCSNGSVVTDKLIYSATISLSSELFSDPQGYYIAWERCCRNYTITNIFSDPPNGDGSGNYAGQTFYLEFPPVVKDGEAFINSSPQLFPPLNDYACPNRPYWVDFAGFDADGDSLVYSLTTPLSTHAGVAIPAAGPGPAPFPKVNWKPPFGLINIMNGAPDLEVSNTGFLTVTPTQQGLYVFAVKCEEFRAGEKIGEVIRDFQMLVVDKCALAFPPEISGRKLTDTGFPYTETMQVTFPNTVSDDERCIEVQVSDPDALNAQDNNTENIWLKAIPLNFNTEKNLNEVLPTVSSATLINGSVESFKICFNECPYVESGLFKIGVIAFDDACALPLSDTLEIDVEVVPPANTPAYFVTNDVVISVKEGLDYSLPIQGLDDDNDPLVVDVLPNGFNLEDVGMSVDNETLSNGSYTSTFNWKTGCDVYDFTEQTEFEVKIVLDDQDKCDFGDPDTLNLNLQIILPPNTDPVISSDLTNTNFAHQINTPVSFKVMGLDTDGDDLELSVIGDGFDIGTYKMDFPELTTGNSNVEATFNWLPPCELFGQVEENKFNLFFLLNDKDKCKFPNYDSLEVTIHLVPPFNSAPTLRVSNLNTEVQFANRTANVTIGQQLALELNAEDDAKDSVWLELLTVNGEPDPGVFSFENAVGKGGAVSELTWQPDCSSLGLGFTPKDYTLAFKLYDNKCANPMADTVELTIKAKDVEQLVKEFVPANVITPNGDGKNDTYSIPNLPLDDCLGKFLGFRVHNRWGTEVYATNDRNFVWAPKNLPSGVYYYAVKFSNRDYNGTITILY